MCRERYWDKLLIDVEEELVILAALLGLRGSLSCLLHLTCNSTRFIDLKAHVSHLLTSFDGTQFAFVSDFILSLSSIKGDNLAERKLECLIVIALTHH